MCGTLWVPPADSSSLCYCSSQKTVLQLPEPPGVSTLSRRTRRLPQGHLGSGWRSASLPLRTRWVPEVPEAGSTWKAVSGTQSYRDMAPAIPPTHNLVAISKRGSPSYAEGPFELRPTLACTFSVRGEMLTLVLIFRRETGRASSPCVSLQQLWPLRCPHINLLQ